MTRAEKRRQEKEQTAKPVYYQYTLAQIEDIKRRAVLEKKEEMKANIAKEISVMVEKEWAEREAALTGETEAERVKKVLALLMSVPAKILCEKFHWRAIQGEDDKRSRLLQFSEAVAREVNRICDDTSADIRKIQEEVYEKYGVKYEVRDEEDEKTEELKRNESM